MDQSADYFNYESVCLVCKDSEERCQLPRAQRDTVTMCVNNVLMYNCEIMQSFIFIKMEP